MADIKTVFISMQQGADYALDGLLLADDDGLDTTVILSLFTDRRANDDDILPASDGDKRGAWIDTYAEVEGDQFGSRLWLLDRAKLIPDTVNKIKDYCTEALIWLVRDGVAKSVNVSAEIIRNHPLGIIKAQIDITKPDGAIKRYVFDDLWSAM
jgi:phage gp46-like protein